MRRVRKKPPPLIPPLDKVSFAAFVEVFGRRPVLTWILNSTIVVVGSTAISLVVSALAGYSLSRFHTPAQKFAGAALLLTKMLPGSLIVIPFFVMFTTAHLIDSRWGLVVANVAVGVPFATWMMKGFFDTLPRELEQAAAIDGCTPLQALWHVMLPLARPGLAACGIYLAIVAMKVLRGDYEKRGYEIVEIAGLYWHFVDLVWVFIFAFFYLW